MKRIGVKFMFKTKSMYQIGITGFRLFVYIIISALCFVNMKYVFFLCIKITRHACCCVN